MPQFGPPTYAQYKLQKLEKTREKYLKKLNKKTNSKDAPQKKLNINSQGTGKVGGGGQSENVLASQNQQEQHIQELEVLAFEHNDEQSKDNKELVSVTPSQVGNEIGATFWENEQELPSNLGTANNSEQQSNGADSSNDLHDNPTLEVHEREDIDINEEREEEEGEGEEDD